MKKNKSLAIVFFAMAIIFVIIVSFFFSNGTNFQGMLKIPGSVYKKMPEIQVDSTAKKLQLKSVNQLSDMDQKAVTYSLDVNLDAGFDKVMAYSSMSKINEKLKSLVFSKKSGGITNGLELSKMVYLQYNPLLSNSDKEKFFQSVFSDVNFPNIPDTENSFNSEKTQIYKKYIITLVHSIWMENFGKLSWSLKDYSQDQIAILFFSGNYFIDGYMDNDIPLVGLSSVQFDGLIKHNVREEGAYKLYGIAKKLVESDIKGSVLNSVDWVRTNFFHAYNNSSLNEQWGFDRYKDNQTEKDGIQLVPGGPVLYQPVSLNRLFEERIVGCHEPSEVLQDILRAMNIPAVALNFQGHGVVYIPNLDVYVHGDHVALGHLFESEDYLLQQEQIIPGDSTDVVLQNKYSDFYEKAMRSVHIGRTGNSLKLSLPSQSMKSIAGGVWDDIVDEMDEFHITRDASTGVASANTIPIQTLDSLSQL